jgi:hypothetical protein
VGMNKQDSIEEWLKDNSEKSKSQIEKYLYTELKSSGLEDRDIFHFLESLNSKENNLSPKIIKAVKNVKKEFDGVIMFKRWLALIIDFFMCFIVAELSFIVFSYFEPVLGVGIVHAVLVLIYSFLYPIYFCWALYKFHATLGLYFLKVRIEFIKNDFRLLKIIAREIIWFTVFTGIGFISYLIWGAYWDKATGAYAVRIKKIIL